MHLSLRKFSFAVVGCIVLFVLGDLVLHEAHDLWLRQEVLLTRFRAAPRLVTYEANPSEFVLRCMFVASLGGFFFSYACVVILGLLHRLVVLRQKFLFSPFKSSVAQLLLVVPLGLISLWVALLVFLPLYYD